MCFINFDLSVRDFGCGMSQNSIDRLFIDFNKIEESIKNNKHGVGLGLSICKSLIENMAGSVKVESKLGEGTKFTISFKTTCMIEEKTGKQEEQLQASHNIFP